MPRRVPLPDELATRPFTLHEGVGRGLTSQRLRGRDLARPFHGVRESEPDSTIRGMCRAYQTRMPPDHVFSHVTAGLLIGLPLPATLQRDNRVHVSAFAPRRAPECAGVAGHQLHAGPGDVQTWDGFRLTSPVRTWIDLATMLDWRDLTVIGDHLVADRRPIATVEHLANAVGRRNGRRGMRALRRALQEIRTGSLSPMETRTRLLLIEAGLPEPELNARIYDLVGNFLAMTDLSFPEYKVAVEYQGDYHRSEPGRYRADIVRRERLEDAGWRVVQITADDLFLRPEETIRRIASALLARGWRP